LITIRKAVHDDRDKIRKIINNTALNELFFDALPEHTLVVEVENTVVGYGALDISKNLAIIKYIYIVPHYRNQGFGDGLVRALINYADRRGVQNIYVFSDDDEINYFKRFGFKSITLNECDIEIFKTFNIDNYKYPFVMKLDVGEFFINCHCH